MASALRMRKHQNINDGADKAKPKVGGAISPSSSRKFEAFYLFLLAILFGSIFLYTNRSALVAGTSSGNQKDRIMANVKKDVSATAAAPRSLIRRDGVKVKKPAAAADKKVRPTMVTDTTTDKRHRLVLSYSLYGNATRYTEGMIITAQQVPEAYPGWEMSIYYDQSVPAYIIDQLKVMSHVELVNINTDLPPWVAATVNSMSWRFWVASDPSVRAFCIRDGDSQPTKRDRAAVEEWLSSGKNFHILRDHPLHNPSKFAIILGGMWGALGKAMPDMQDRLYQHYVEDKHVQKMRMRSGKYGYAEDQDFLFREVLPLAKNDCLQHDSYYCDVSGGIAFPMKRGDDGSGQDFVGNSINRRALNSTTRSLSHRQKQRLVEEEAVNNYKKCLKLRETAMAAGGAVFPDTSYKGQTELSSTEMMQKTIHEAVHGPPK